RVCARDADVRSAAKMDSADAFDGERCDVVDIALHDPFEAVANADDLAAFQPGADGGGADDTVDTGSGPAARDDCEIGVLIHSAERISEFGARPRAALRQKGVRGRQRTD